MPARPAQLPEPALSWMLGERFDPRVLTLSANAGLTKILVQLTRHTTVIDKDFDKIAGLHQHYPEPVTAVARAEDLPFEACCFDVVLAHQILPRLAPGLAYSEMARVLRPGGWVAASQMVRDDSVPWVRRLIALMRSVDPSAMSGDFDQDAVDALTGSKYFPRIERVDFRVWVPVSRNELIEMAVRQPSIARGSDRERQQMATAVGAIFDGASTGAELALPYQLRCYRCYVDHAELTTPIRFRDDVLVIPL